MKDKRTIRAVILFLALSFALTWSIDILAILGFDFGINTMFCPAVGAVVVKFVYYRNERVLGLRLCSPKYILYALLLPLFYFGVSYSLYLILNPIAYSGVIYSNDPMVLIIIFISYFVSAAGEEIGWRGFLFPKLAELFGFNRAAVAGGLIWSFWHYPILIYYFFQSPNGLYMLLMFTAEITLIGIIMAYLLLYSKSVLPATMLHACHNYFDQIIFGPMTNSLSVSYFAGETGIFTLALVGLAVILIKIKHKTKKDLYNEAFI